MQEEILKTVSDNAKTAKFTLKIDDSKFSLNGVSIIKSATPVNSPTLRGGVYFSDKIAYRMKATVDDASIIPMLSQFMLGPNRDYNPMEIFASVQDGDKTRTVSIKAYLTSSMQRSSMVELNLLVADLRYSD